MPGEGPGPTPMFPGDRPGLRAALRYFVGHHPLCTAYREDVRLVGPTKIPVCVGCAIVYPSGLLAGPLLSVALARADGSFPVAAAVVGFSLGGLQLAGYVFRVESRALRTAIKAGLGLGVMLFVGGVLALDAAWTLKVGLLAAAYLVLAATQALRVLKLKRKCRKCVWKADWQRCPGFYPFNRYQ